MKNISANFISLKAAAKARRDMEISMYGKPIHRSVVMGSKVTYTRKQKHKQEYV